MIHDDCRVGKQVHSIGGWIFVAPDAAHCRRSQASVLRPARTVCAHVTGASAYLSRSLIWAMPTTPHSSSFALGPARLPPIAPMTSPPAVRVSPPAKVSRLVSDLILATTLGSVFVNAPTCDVGILKVSAV